MRDQRSFSTAWMSRSATTTTTAYRLVQEALTNVVEHAAADKARVRVTPRGAGIVRAVLPLAAVGLADDEGPGRAWPSAPDRGRQISTRP